MSPAAHPLLEAMLMMAIGARTIYFNPVVRGVPKAFSAARRHQNARGGPFVAGVAGFAEEERLPCEPEVNPVAPTVGGVVRKHLGAHRMWPRQKVAALRTASRYERFVAAWFNARKQSGELQPKRRVDRRKSEA